MARILRIINYLIATAVLILLVAAWWYAWRPLPQTSGTVQAPVSAPVTVARDALGAVHIRAASLEDALFAQGYAVAQDRLFQLDAQRRLASGTLAEVVGPAALELDRDMRRLRTRRIAEAAYQQVPAQERAEMTAYARGVNHFIRTHLDRLPLEFSLLRYDPRPWSVVDTLLVGVNMFRTLTTTWRDELIKHNMLASGDKAKVDFLWPVRGGGEVQVGSNGWVVAGNRTASGRPLLSNDMHLEMTLPGIWYMADLEAPGLHVSGVALPGVPGVIVGHNDRIAWGITNLHFDVQDLYIEKFDERTGRYEFRGQVEQARPERELIQVKGGKPEELPVWVTRHGPLLVADGGVRMALRWVAAEPGTLQVPILAIDRARNWQDFLAAIRQFGGPGSNFIYADVDGNIGYHGAGRMPIRRNYRGDVPVDGASGEYEWDGYIPFEQLPSAFNPPEGVIVTANQCTFPVQYPYTVNGNFAPYYRSKQIHDLLLARKGWKPQEMLAVQTDIYSGFSHFLAGQLVSAYRKRKAHNPSVEPAVELLSSWNGQMEKSLAAPLVAALAYQHLRTAIAEVASPAQGRAYEYNLGSTVVERLLRERPAGWFRDWDETLVRILADAVEEGQRMQGRETKRWRYGKYLKVTVANPVVRNLPWIGPYFNIGPVEMSGSTSTVKQTTWRVGPSMRMTADLSDWDKSLLNLPFGQSGQVLSRHYRDQWPEYYSAHSFPMQFRKVEVKDSLVLRP